LLAEDAVLLAEQAALQAALIEEMRLGDLPFVTKVAMEKGAETGAAYFNKLRDADMLWWFGFGLSEWRFKGSINSKGYELMSAGNLEQAFELFTLNTMIFSRDWNVWDSLGECCEKMKKTDFAIQHFEKSLELNPDNENAKTALERLRKG
jgi:tetratricopeptide (TPR) repeat protein